MAAKFHSHNPTVQIQIWNPQMWCPNCQADVAAEVITGSQRARCATCGTEIDTGSLATTGVKTDEARELLRRWADDDLLDPFGPLPPLAETQSNPSLPATPSTDEQRLAAGQPLAPAYRERPPAAAEREQSSSGSVFRFDSAHAPSEDPRRSAATAELNRAGIAPETAPPVSEPRPKMASIERVHQPHVAQAPAPHFDVQSAIEEDRALKTNWSSFWGQILAYFGVAGLTVGTSLVLWGYFGGPTSYTPTGWLVATAGQMLLFLGVVTLISGGMEQTTEEVARRIDRLSASLDRIEQASRNQSLRGPYTAPGQFTGEQRLPPDAERKRQHA